MVARDTFQLRSAISTGSDVIGTRDSSIGGRSESGPGLMRQRAVI